MTCVTCNDPMTGTLADACASCVELLTEESKQRNWTTVGTEYVERLGRDSVERKVKRMKWQDVPEGGNLTVGFMPGEAINAAIRDLSLPKVSAVAIDSFSRPPASGEEDGFYPGFYGIQCRYKNGAARVYVLDTGTTLTPLFSDFWPVAAMTRAFKYGTMNSRKFHLPTRQEDLVGEMRTGYSVPVRTTRPDPICGADLDTGGSTVTCNVDEFDAAGIGDRICAKCRRAAA